jgi:trk system potassium uptake protein TrkH
MTKFSSIYIGSFLIFISILSFINIIYSNYFDIFFNIETYVYTFAISFILGSLLFYLNRKSIKKITLYEKIFTVLLGYFLFPLIISIPYYFSIQNISLLNSYFEAISGFTSTGFTIFDNIKQLDESLILWRSTSQWIGGIYFLFSILLLIDIFDKNLKKSFTEYLSFNYNEIFKQSLKIIIIYTLLTLLIFIVFKILNLRTFDAFNLSLSIISSGGFLPVNRIDYLFDSDISKIFLSFTMVLSFFSLFLTYNLIFYNKKKINFLSEDLNLLIYLLVIISFSFIFFNTSNNFPSILVAISSSISNIGISFSDTPSNLIFMFFIMVIIGGSFFSTSSGIRVIKILSLIKFSINNLLSHTKPNQIYSNKVTLINENTEKSDINKYFFSIIIFIISLFILTLLLTLSEINFEQSFKLSILTIMNTVNSSMFELSNFDFYNLSLFTKVYLIIFMIIGRVELLTILILFKKFLFKN